MNHKDPIQEVEEIVKELHDEVGKYTVPVLQRYPLLFTFLIVFSVASILDGFRMMTDRMEIFEAHPLYLIIIGIVALFLTGQLYKSLRKM